VIKDRKVKYVSLNVDILPKYWDENHEKVKPGHTNSIRINNYLVERTRAALDSILETVTDHPDTPITSLKQSIMGIPQIDYFAFAEKLIKQYEIKNMISTYRRFKYILAKFKKYNGPKELSFNQISVKFLKDYEYYLRTDCKNSTNTIISNFKALRHIYNDAINENLFTVKINPFLNYKLKWENTEKVFLTEEEISALELLNLQPGSKKFHHRNLYIFACFAGGIRISDLLQLKWENFDGTHILLNTQKTGSVVSVLLPGKALEILNIYKSPESEKEDFIFPFLNKSDNLSDPGILLKKISSINAYANTDLRDLAKMAGIKKKIHFHTSRHTWATRALRKGMRIEYVSKLMGHSSIRTTQVYAKIINADLDEAMKVFN
jgi:integrase/recombinase XerD